MYKTIKILWGYFHTFSSIHGTIHIFRTIQNINAHKKHGQVRSYTPRLFFHLLVIDFIAWNLGIKGAHSNIISSPVWCNPLVVSPMVKLNYQTRTNRELCSIAYTAMSIQRVRVTLHFWSLYRRVCILGFYAYRSYVFKEWISCYFTFCSIGCKHLHLHRRQCRLAIFPLG